MIKSAIVAAAMLMSTSAFAQTCASPIHIQSDNTNGLYPSGTNGVTTVDTCTATNTFPLFPGSIGSPQNDIVYDFTAQGANATITVDATGSPLIAGALILDGCDDTANVYGNASAAAAGQSIAVSATGLTDGAHYYFVVTSAPGSPDANCGAYTGTITGTLPVSLQKFSVE
jgi:hypothetical protein